MEGNDKQMDGTQTQTDGAQTAGAPTDGEPDTQGLMKWVKGTLPAGLPSFSVPLGEEGAPTGACLFGCWYPGDPHLRILSSAGPVSPGQHAEVLHGITTSRLPEGAEDLEERWTEANTALAEVERREPEIAWDTAATLARGVGLPIGFYCAWIGADATPHAKLLMLAWVHPRELLERLQAAAQE